MKVKLLYAIITFINLVIASNPDDTRNEFENEPSKYNEDHSKHKRTIKYYDSDKTYTFAMKEHQDADTTNEFGLVVGARIMTISVLFAYLIALIFVVIGEAYEFNYWSDNYEVDDNGTFVNDVMTAVEPNMKELKEELTEDSIIVPTRNMKILRELFKKRLAGIRKDVDEEVREKEIEMEKDLRKDERKKKERITKEIDKKAVVAKDKSVKKEEKKKEDKMKEQPKKEVEVAKKKKEEVKVPKYTDEEWKIIQQELKETQPSITQDSLDEAPEGAREKAPKGFQDAELKKQEDELMNEKTEKTEDEQPTVPEKKKASTGVNVTTASKEQYKQFEKLMKTVKKDMVKDENVKKEMTIREEVKKVEEPVIEVKNIEQADKVVEEKKVEPVVVAGPTSVLQPVMPTEAVTKTEDAPPIESKYVPMVNGQPNPESPNTQ